MAASLRTRTAQGRRPAVAGGYSAHVADSDTDSARTPDDGSTPVDVDGMGAVIWGTALWVVGLVVCLVLRGPLAEAGRGWWTYVCLTGALLGIPGYLYVTRRRAAYRRRAAASSD